MRMILESYDGYEILVAKWRFEGSSQVISFYHDGLGMPIDDIEVVMPKGSWVFERDALKAVYNAMERE